MVNVVRSIGGGVKSAAKSKVATIDPPLTVVPAVSTDMMLVAVEISVKTGSPPRTVFTLARIVVNFAAPAPLPDIVKIFGDHSTLFSTP